ncbi:unnamed protein product [Ceratitis capitata]|uniref:(Mediterranean fruit fly) hypothetical protein n=1 Tax=Ceratitis capitata TaxID=7213 RepID=A0A811ULM5_CERCA|nr:unnamed protein product [Ceratitis capitata]
MSVTSKETSFKQSDIVEKLFKTPNLQGLYDELGSAEAFGYDDVDYAGSLELEPTNPLTVMSLNCDWERDLYLAPRTPPIASRNFGKIQLSAGWCPLLAKLAKIDAKDYAIDVRSTSPQSITLESDELVEEELLQELDEITTTTSVSFKITSTVKSIALQAGDFGHEANYHNVKCSEIKNVPKLTFNVIQDEFDNILSISANIFDDFLTLYHCDIFMASQIERPLRHSLVQYWAPTHEQSLDSRNSIVGACDDLAVQQLHPASYSSREFATKSQMLMKWLISSLQQSGNNLSEQDLNNLTIQYCNNLINVGVLKQISEETDIKNFSNYFFMQIQRCVTVLKPL